MQNFLDHASKMYYEGTPIISDAEFDILSAHFDYGKLGHQITDGIPHFHPMYSLQKCFNLDKAPLNTDLCVCTPKLDGAAVSILFVGGSLSLGLTRGDGKLGRDITEKVKLLIPNNISDKNVIQINGEVLAPVSVPNARNFAAGSLNLKSIEEFSGRDLVFVAYDIVENPYDYWTNSMSWLRTQGFNTVDKFDCSNYPTDGWVYRLNDIPSFRALGYTSHHPRGAFALKPEPTGVVTKLLDVIWQVGKSGVISPVAMLEPVKIGDATISKATLHNIAYINSLDLEIGCSVEVIRSGEIIPRIVKRID